MCVLFLGFYLVLFSDEEGGLAPARGLCSFFFLSYLFFAHFLLFYYFFLLLFLGQACVREGGIVFRDFFITHTHMHIIHTLSFGGFLCVLFFDTTIEVYG